MGPPPLPRRDVPRVIYVERASAAPRSDAATKTIMWILIVGIGAPILLALMCVGSIVVSGAASVVELSEKRSSPAPIKQPATPQRSRPEKVK